MSQDSAPESKSRILRERITRIMLRVLPLVPGPEIYDLIAELSESRNSLDEKVNQAYESLQAASKLIAELEDGLKDRVAKVEKLKEEYTRYSALAEVEENKANALLSQLELTVGKGKAQERVIGFVLNLVAGVIIFVLGALASPYIARWLDHSAL